MPQPQVIGPKRSFTPFLVPLALLIGIGAFLIYLSPRAARPAKLTEEERSYFEVLYRDTWNYLAAFVEKKTGLPYDSSAEQPPTSMTNVGLYLASTAIATRTSLISNEEGLERVQKCLESLEKIETWRGFPRPWVLVRTLKPTHGEEFSYGPHLASLLGGLVVAKTTFPQVAPAIDRMLLKMDFKSFYESRNGWLKGGYNVRTQNFAIYQSWGHWYYKYFAAETRLLSFYLVARKVVPKKHWYSLIRPIERKEGESYFVSGLQDGGLAPQYGTGLFLDERETEIGRSQKSMARAQMKYAKRIGAPVWGWSPAESPNGQYLVEGELRDEIVAPYASILASLYFPKQAYQNLRSLEKLGARQSIKDSSEGYGFRDSLNWKSGAVARNSLTLSQGMVFLALANLLYDGIVWKSFGEDPVVKQGFAIL